MSDTNVTNLTIPTEFSTEIYGALSDVENIIYFKWITKDNDYLEFMSPVEHCDYDLPQSVSPASSAFFRGDIIHPDDREIFETFLDQMFWMQDTKNDHKLFITKARLRAKGGNGYLWVEFRLMLYFDNVGPVIAFGCLCNINVKQLWQLELQHSAEHDVLTGFYNKTATQHHIDEYLSTLTDTDIPPAFLIIDADGFKAINDAFGHLFGDGVLSDMGHEIRNIFRQKDIVGRIGGDEFVVLFREMPSLDVLDKRCSELLRSLDRTYESNNVSLPFSISIGVALYPEHGTSYTELFKRADRALYESKSLGKNRYSIYRSSLIGRSFAVESERDPQHAEDIRQKAFQDNMLEFILNLLYETQNPEVTVQVCLEMFGKQFNLDRVCVNRFNRTSNKYSFAFEWVSPNGISLNSEDIVKQYPFFVDRYCNIVESNYHPSPYGVTSICENTFQKFKDDAEGLEKLKLGSFAHCQFSHSGELLGSIGFESAHPREWEKEILTKISIFSVLLGNILLDRKSDTVAEKMNRHLQNILDHMQEFIYVVDKNTYEPIFFNNTIRQTLITSSSAQTCYKRFHNLNEPCKDCPVKRLSKDGNEYIDVRINNWGVETPARAYNIHWEDEMDKNLALIIQSSF
ncbi:MAG: GGDEF domain-containing protein [Selenomonadaceae bacterium]|nr:GGDEF domain-containing protein [Selenomonadaceae bacterium]